MATDSARAHERRRSLPLLARARVTRDAASVRSASTGDALVGRARELGALRSALNDAADGMGRLVLLVGEPGIGKTRLAREIAGRALTVGHGVAWGRCVEADGAPPYWPWLQILRSLGLETDALSTTVESPEERFRRTTT